MSKDSDRKRETLRLVLSSNCRVLREKAGFSQRELAVKMGVHRFSIMRLESGETTEPSWFLACALADVFGLPVSELRNDLSAHEKSRS